MFGKKSIGLNIYSDSIIDKGMVLSKRGNTTGKSAFWKKFKKQKVLKKNYLKNN